MAATTKQEQLNNSEIELTGFYVGGLLVGVNIMQIQEINRNLELTSVPHAPDFVRGVVNLRGEVVTVVDLRKILGMEPAEITEKSRNVIVTSKDEQIGLLVDRIADVVTVPVAQIAPPPPNVNGVDGSFFKGVYKMESELLIILDIEEALAGETVNH